MSTTFTWRVSSGDPWTTSVPSTRFTFSTPGRNTIAYKAQNAIESTDFKEEEVLIFEAFLLENLQIDPAYIGDPSTFIAVGRFPSNCKFTWTQGDVILGKTSTNTYVHNLSPVGPHRICVMVEDPVGAAQKCSTANVYVPVRCK